MGGLILFHIAFVSSKRYSGSFTNTYLNSGFTRFKVTNLTENQYFDYMIHIRSRDVPNLYQVELLKTMKSNSMFGLPESTIYFIYSGYFFLFMAFVIFYSGQPFKKTEI